MRQYRGPAVSAGQREATTVKKGNGLIFLTSKQDTMFHCVFMFQYNKKHVFTIL